MNQTPQSNRLTVAVYGMTNSGKSALFNAITDTRNAIVSPVAGTTTDPVVKSMELLPHGPIVLIDTAGGGDGSELGPQRMKKTREVLARTDFALYAMDPAQPQVLEYEQFQKELATRKIPHLLLLTKSDTARQEDLKALQDMFPEALQVSVAEADSLEKLKNLLSQKLDGLAGEEHYQLKGLLPPGSVVVMVVPVDSEAPKGRLILPQVQLIRECLDLGMRCHVTTETGLAQAIGELEHVDLVVTDSQAFALVNRLVPPAIPLTSFSILMARQKGDIDGLIAGVAAAGTLEHGSGVLIAETCTHNRSHEDIGRVKIPKLLQAKTGKQLEFTFTAGREYPEDLERYSLVVHCGGCMITRKEMLDRQRQAMEKGVPVTNYGVLLAWANGILERSTAILRRNGNTR